MEFKGTKGEWSIRETFDPNYDQPVLSIDSLETCTEDIITVWSGQDLGNKINEVTRADALLISKAPEMLEMLNHVKGYLGSDQRELVEKLINEATNV